MSSAAKENAPLHARRRQVINIDADIQRTTGGVATTMDTEGTKMMLSPPPEEELRSMRRNNEPGSAQKPLRESARPNQASPGFDHLQSAKRKRTLTNKDTPPRPTREARDAHQRQPQAQITYTPNPRVRKHVRHGSHSPTASSFPDGAPLLLHSGSPDAGEASTSALHGDAADFDVSMSPIRKGKGRARPSPSPRTLNFPPQSPHATNPDADYVPPSHLAVSTSGVSVRRRSVTPIPPYEPPKERFTPPREIISTPIGSGAEKKAKPKRAQPKKLKRAAAVKAGEARSGVPMKVKTEPPEIDLTAPLPPASPSEDPILLVGPPPAAKKKTARRSSLSKDASKDLVEFAMDLDLPVEERRKVSARNHSPFSVSSSPFIEQPPAHFDFSGINADDTVDFGTNDFNGSGSYGGGGWTDSDDDDEEVISEGEGEFTGRFSTKLVPTKMDPPTSATRERMEDFGRPRSPHPKRFSVGEGEEDEEVEEEHEEEDNQGRAEPVREPDHSDDEEEGHTGYDGPSGRRLTLSELEAQKFGPGKQSFVREKTPENDNNNLQGEDVAQNSFLDEDDSLTELEEALDEHNDSLDTLKEIEDIPHENSRQVDEEIVLDEEDANLSIQDEYEETADSSTAHNTSGEPSGDYSFDDAKVAEESFSRSVFQDHAENDPLNSEPVEDDTLDREVSEEGVEDPAIEIDVGVEEQAGKGEGDSESDTEEEIVDTSVVKIVSNDPLAAARAAAILKLHDYDMIARRLRRKNAYGGGVRKSYGTPQRSDKWRRRTIAALSAEDHLGATVDLPELLHRAEEELRNTPSRSRAGSVSVAGTPRHALIQSEHPPRRFDAGSGPREWVKADWKLLDSCFTDERAHVAEMQGLPMGDLCDVDDIDPSNVVNRFIVLVGGPAVLEPLGSSWTSDKLLQRVRALSKRQRDGQGAPPTPQLSSRFVSALSPSSSMIVPDFTPTPAERFRRFGRSDFASAKPSLPPADSSSGLFKVPLPPHLKERATSSLIGTPRSAGRLSRFSTPELSENGDDSYQHREHDPTNLSTPMTPVTQRIQEQQTPMSAVKRSLDYISSWLRPGMFASKQQQQQKGLSLPGLPVPPPDVLARPRGQVATPERKPAPRLSHPKDEVNLNPVPPPPPSKIPRAQPKRLVDLQHIPTPPPKPLVKTIPRRSSTASVKDLVKEFEQIDKEAVRAIPPRVAELRGMRSIDSLRSKAAERPTWKP